MPVAKCPECGKRVKLPTSVRYAQVRCLRCGQDYHAKQNDTSTAFRATRVKQRRRLPSPPAAVRSYCAGPPPVNLSRPPDLPPVPEPQREPHLPPRPNPEREPDVQPSPTVVRQDTLLTGPHACSRCRAAIPTPTGLPQTTINCPTCGNRTSLYAVLHRCPDCGRLLESPNRAAGSLTSCPACQAPLVVPHHLAYARATAWMDEAWFRVQCAACSQPMFARQEDARRRTACPHCYVAQAIPHWGDALPRPSASPEPRLRHCPRCQLQISEGVPFCPYCKGAVARFS